MHGWGSSCWAPGNPSAISIALTSRLRLSESYASLSRKRRNSSMPAKLAAHRLHDLPGEVFLVSRREARIEGRGQDRTGHALIDGGQEGPAALAGVGHAMFDE